MTGVPRCEWCGKPAVEQCRAVPAKPAKPVTFYVCQPEGECWERTYRRVRSYPERTWKPVEPRKARKDAGQPTLFDHLPERE